MAKTTFTEKPFTDWTPEERQIYFDKLKAFINDQSSYNEKSGVVVTRVEESYCEGEMAITPLVMNTQGSVHGGALFTLADTVTGIAASSTGRHVVTLNASYSYIRAGTGTKIRCIANRVATGTGAALFNATLVDDQERVVGRGSFSFFFMGPRVLD